MNESIGSNIREFRKKKGMTQRELAVKIDKSYSSIQKYELDIAVPPLSVIHEIAAALGVDAWEIIGFNNVEFPDEGLPPATVIDYEEAQNTLRIILTEKEFTMVRAFQAADERAQDDAILLLQTHKK